MKKGISIVQKFSELSQKKEGALIAYLTAGYPSLAESVAHVELLVQAGADMIEIGIPFSDPVADGPTIQHSSQIALNNGTKLSTILKQLDRVDTGVPLILMSYLNPIIAYGSEQFFQDSSEVGITGVVIPDLPLEESHCWIRSGDRYGIDVILLLTPTTPEERIVRIAEAARGFVYCVSVCGTTGVRDTIPALSCHISCIRRVTDMPIAVGFGISTPEHVRTVCKYADGAIVGSRFIEATRNGEDIAALMCEFKEATRR